mmetsp:Transcript_52392/g.119467  ORF Transcript_52392/g.119467 Transcript_52392/m.119467 type:complete len:231 (-) Transcript_52392:356-1048(-)
MHYTTSYHSLPTHGTYRRRWNSPPRTIPNLPMARTVGDGLHHRILKLGINLNNALLNEEHLVADHVFLENDLSGELKPRRKFGCNPNRKRLILSVRQQRDLFEERSVVEHLDLLLELGRQRLQNVLLVVQLPLSVLDPVEVSHLLLHFRRDFFRAEVLVEGPDLERERFPADVQIVHHGRDARDEEGVEDGPDVEAGKRDPVLDGAPLGPLHAGRIHDGRGLEPNANHRG